MTSDHIHSLLARANLCSAIQSTEVIRMFSSKSVFSNARFFTLLSLLAPRLSALQRTMEQKMVVLPRYIRGRRHNFNMAAPVYIGLLFGVLLGVVPCAQAQPGAPVPFVEF